MTTPIQPDPSRLQQPHATNAPNMVTPAGRRPQICPSWLSREEFDVCKNDPYRAFDAAQNKIAELQQRVTVAKKLNAALLQDPQYQFGQAVQNFEKLKSEHIALNDVFNDQEAVNETVQEVLEFHRGNKHELLVDLNSIRREITIQGIENQQLESKARQIKAYNDSLDLKLMAQENQLANLDDESREAAKTLTQLSNERVTLESTCQSLSLQSSSLSDLRQHLETTRVAQDRAIQALEREVQGKVQELVQHDTQLWEFKREMSGRMLALQKKAQECTDEMGRLQRLSQHEMATLAAQNRALNDELKSTADALFTTRKEKTDFSNTAKRELNQRKEEITQCLSVIDLLERQNAGLEASIARMMEQNKLSERQSAEKDTINNKQLIEQSNFLAMVHMELQSTMEDLYILKARLCHHCRENILDPEENLEARFADMAGQPTQQQQQQQQSPGGTITQGGGGGTSQIKPMEFDPQTGAPLGVPQQSGGNVGSSFNDPDRSRLEADLRRTKETLEALNRTLLEERAQREIERQQDEELKIAEEEERIAKSLEEDARRKRQTADERKLQAGEEAKTFTVRFMDGSRKKVEAFMSDTIGEIITRVCQKIDVRRTDLFYLAHSVNENSVLGAVDRFLDKHKTLEQENVTPKSNLVFKYKHYKRHRRWNDKDASQEWFFRQIHQNVITEYYPVSEKLAVELASFEIQSVFGDYSGKIRHSYFDKVGLDSYLPVSVSAHDYAYWQERLFDIHKKRKGLSPIEARNRYIEQFAAKSPYWGMTFFDVRDRDNRPFLAGVAEDGLYILSASKRDVLKALRFDQLLGWERGATGITVKTRGSLKQILFGSSKLQSKEMVDLLNEYYMMLPQDLRDRLSIVIDNADEYRSRLPSADLFEGPIIARKKPVEYYSRLEYLKNAYMEHCLTAAEDGTRRQPIPKLTQMIDRALDEDRSLEDLDLSNCDPPLDDWQWAVIHELMQHTMEQVNPQDIEQWRENIDIHKLSLAHPRERQALTEHCVPNVCNFIRKFGRLTHVNLSYIPLENRNEADIASSLVQLPDLESLVMRGCKIGSKGFQSILQVFSIVPSKLRTLDLEHNMLTHSSVQAICGVMEGDCALTSLNLGHNFIDGVGLETMIATLKRKRRLQYFDFSGNPGAKAAIGKFADLISSSVGITDLNISSSAITGDQGVRIAAELKSKGELRKLNISDNPIGPTLQRQRQTGSGEISRDYPAEFFAFLDVGAYCNIKELIMDRCQLHEDAGQALASVLHNNAKLTDLIVTNNQLAGKSGSLPPTWTDMLPINQYLTKLHLSYNAITYQGIMNLFQAMMRNRSIQELKIDGNTLDRYSPNSKHQELVSCLEHNTSLTHLSMVDMFMKDDVLIKLGEGLQRNRGLKRLNAHNNEIGVRGVSELARRLSENTTLEFMDLSCRSVQVNDELYLQAYKSLIDLSNLETVLL